MEKNRTKIEAGAPASGKHVDAMLGLQVFMQDEPDGEDAAQGLSPANVRFGSKADMCAAKRHVRFTPNSDRESGFRQNVMSALPPKADMCGAVRMSSAARTGSVIDPDNSRYRN
jgi:hypothetical protein